MKTKSILASKTFWLNIIAALLGCLAVFTPEMLSGLGLGENAQEKALVIIGGITTVLNIILRILTNSAVTLPGKTPLVLLVLLLGFGSCTSTQKSISAKNSLERILNYAKEKGDASVKKESNGAITTTVKFKDFYNPEKVKEKFRKFIAVFNATEPSVTITATTQDSTIVIPQLPLFKK